LQQCPEEMEQGHQGAAAPDQAEAWADEEEDRGEWAEHVPEQGPAGTVSAPTAGQVFNIRWELPATI